MSDVVDFLITQHDQIQQLGHELERNGGDDRRRLFAEFDLRVNLHELGDRTVVHPAARDSTPTGDAIGVACMAEESSILRRLGELHEAGVDDAGFDRGFALLREQLSAHNAHEERDEFPLLRLYVKPQRLHMMVGQLHDVQVMGVR